MQEFAKTNSEHLVAKLTLVGLVCFLDRHGELYQQLLTNSKNCLQHSPNVLRSHARKLLEDIEHSDCYAAFAASNELRSAALQEFSTHSDCNDGVSSRPSNTNREIKAESEFGQETLAKQLELKLANLTTHCEQMEQFYAKKRSRCSNESAKSTLACNRCSHIDSRKKLQKRLPSLLAC
eukprot:CAMPEP_0168341228 /NCGR_PEP_ID=MMETSP0213-20121227/14547_1 /TAXON_ID=151035 /ORGANISM="Euplotes harpa, Strain FSP1.4" /LENGTH=178 /DNA_ID=CAMNT_0008347641 /DNA_START=98 /DNA_END=634 /DNA_ORIENTATION=-